MSRFLLRQSWLLVIVSLSSATTASSQSPGAKLLFSTYLGGNGFDEGFAVTTDINGDLYVAGLTTSTSFPGSALGLAGADGVFVSKFSPAGQLLYTSRLGGSGFTEAFGIAVDQTGNVYVTGQTNSTDLPVVNGFQPTYGGGFSDAFVAKFDPSGTLVYSSFLGGSSPANEFGHAIAVDATGTVYISGTTSALDFPVRHAFQSTYGGGFSDAFVAAINTNVSGVNGLVYATYLGSFGFDSGNAIAVDSGGNVVVAGTAACCFPTTPGAVQTFLGTAGPHSFVARLGPGGQLMYSTLVGGSGMDVARGVAVDKNGVIYLAGETASADFPTTANGFLVQNRATVTGFISLIDPSVGGPAGLRYSSYVGGSVFDTVGAVSVDEFGRALITGRTESADFPTSNPLQPALAGSDDAFVVQLDPSLAGASGLIYGSFLGGYQHDEGMGITSASGGRIAVTGFTDTPFPVAGPFVQSPAGGREAFVAYLSLDTAPPVLVVPAAATINATSAAGATFLFTATATDREDPNPTVQCIPASGSLFAIGTTLVGCIATDASGNSASGAFNLTVKGAQEQLVDLKLLVGSLGLDKGLTNSLEAKLSAAQQDPLSGACSDLSDFINQVSAKAGTAIPSLVAEELVASAIRIQAVLGCR
jgi:Beta-propeller repeat/HYR domain